MSPPIQRLREQIDSYCDTVYLVLALIHELSWDHEHKAQRTDVVHEHGAEQSTSSQASPVTPDMALLLADEGIIGDAKISFAATNQKKKDIAEQLLKYDRVLTDWMERRRCNAGAVVLLTHYTRKVDAADYFAEAQRNGTFSPKNEFAVIAGTRTDQAKTHYCLERAYGALIPASTDERFRKIVKIALEHLETSYGAVKFYDASPPMLYLAQVIWDKVLPMLVPEETFVAAGQENQNKKDNWPTIQASLDQLTEVVRDGFSMRLLNSSLPCGVLRSAVREALDFLVKCKLGNALASDQYSFRYRKLRKGTLDFLLAKAGNGVRRAKPNAKQLGLFESQKGPTRST